RWAQEKTAFGTDFIYLHIVYTDQSCYGNPAFQLCRGLMTDNSRKKQYFFMESASVDAVLSDNGYHDRGTVSLLRQAMGRKWLPLRTACIPVPPERAGKYYDVNYVTTSPGLVSSALRRGKDMVAHWLKAARRAQAPWLAQRKPDG